MLSYWKKRWLDLGITAKVGLILVTLVLACLTVAASAFFQNTKTTEKLQKVATSLLPATRLSQHALVTFTEELQLYEDALVTDEELLLEKGVAKEKDVELLLTQLGEITTDRISANLSTLSTLQDDIARHTERAVEVYSQIIKNVNEADNEQLYDQAILLGKEAIALRNRLVILNQTLQKLLDSHLADVRKFTMQQQRMGVLLTLFTIALALLISFLLTRLITVPIIGLAEITQKITDGQWSGELVCEGNDEVSKLTRSFSNMLHTLRRREEALQQSEKKYREIFNATREAIIIYDAATMQIIDANNTCCELTGYSREEILSMHYADMGADVESNNRETALSCFQKTLEGQPQIFEWAVRNKRNEIGYTELSLTLSEINHKKVVILVARDISERKKNEEEKQALARQLQQAEKMETLGTLAGGIAHDFNNILAGILGYAELAALHPDTGEKAKSDLENIRKAAFRARDLVAQILAFSRKSDKETTLFEPRVIVKEAVKLLRSSTPATIAIHQNINTSVKIEADPTQIHQITMNLCTNAVQAMEETGGELSITLKETVFDPRDGKLPDNLPAGRYLCFEVKDTGMGMDEKTREKIFDPYFTTKDIGKGTGLGLSVVHGIVKEYGGSITVESQPGQGACFRVYLPAARETVADSTNVQQESLEDILHSRPTGQHIMLVDDEKDLVGLLADFFTQAGYRVSAYTDSKKALADFSSQPEAYDLVITDMTMPGMTGLDLYQYIHSLRPGTPVILMTGYSDQINREKAIALGIRDFFLKPPDMGELLLAVRKILSARQQK